MTMTPDSDSPEVLPWGNILDSTTRTLIEPMVSAASRRSERKAYLLSGIVLSLVVFLVIMDAPVIAYVTVIMAMAFSWFAGGSPHPSAPRSMPTAAAPKTDVTSVSSD